MSGADDYQKEFDNLMQAAEDRAEDAVGHRAERIDARARAVGLKPMEIYSILMNDGAQKLMEEITRREKRKR